MICLKNTIISGSDFDDVNLSKTRVHNVNMADSSFDTVDMSNVVFANTCFVDAEISGSKLAGMRINGILVTDLLECYAKQQGDK